MNDGYAKFLVCCVFLTLICAYVAPGIAAVMCVCTLLVGIFGILSGALD